MRKVLLVGFIMMSVVSCDTDETCAPPPLESDFPDDAVRFRGTWELSYVVLSCRAFNQLTPTIVDTVRPGDHVNWLPGFADGSLIEGPYPHTTVTLNDELCVRRGEAESIYCLERLSHSVIGGALPHNPQQRLIAYHESGTFASFSYFEQLGWDTMQIIIYPLYAEHNKCSFDSPNGGSIITYENYVRP